MTKRKIRKVEMPSMTAERGGRGIGAIRDDDRKSAGFFQYILSTRKLIRERIDPPFPNKFRFPPYSVVDPDVF
jgi:hypothetical protein